MKYAKEVTDKTSGHEEPHSMLEYMENSLYSDLERAKTYHTRKTGYSNIDEYNCLMPALYVLGGLAGEGKTTFCSQMADNLARAGEHVLYFSLEHTELEFVTRGLARITAQEVLDEYGANPLKKHEYTGAVSATDIRGGTVNETVKRAIETYKTFSERLRVIECGVNTDIDTIIATVKQFMARYEGVKPVVFVDYLQLVRNSDTSLTTKEAVGRNVQAFKKLSAENEITVIVISSLDYQNYLSVVDFDSFKETGGIEYIADVIWGLQLVCMNAKVFDLNEGLHSKRKFVHEAITAIPRLVEICELKNRYGEPDMRYLFNYYAEYDLFVPDECEPEYMHSVMEYRYTTPEDGWD